MATEDVEHAVEYAANAGHVGEVVEKNTDPAVRNLEGEVLDGEAAEHDADVHEDGLHSVKADEVREVVVAHDQEEEGEEDEERGEPTGVVGLKERGKELHEAFIQRVVVVDVLSKGQAAHQRHQVRQARHHPEEDIGLALRF